MVRLRNVRQGKGAEAKNPKPSRWGSISGAPSEMGVDISGGRWCSRADKVVMMVRHCICKHNVGEGAKGQNGKIEPLGLNFGHTVGNGGGGRWCGGADEVVVVGRCFCKCEVGEGAEG